jgi:hypothetical protein
MPVSRNRKAHKSKVKARNVAKANKLNQIKKLEQDLAKAMQDFEQAKNYQAPEGPTLTLLNGNDEQINLQVL